MDFTENDDEQERYHYQDKEIDESITKDNIDLNELAEISDENTIQDRIPIENNNNSVGEITHIGDNDENENDDKGVVPETPPPSFRRSTRTSKWTVKYLNYIGRKHNQVSSKAHISQEMK